MQIHQMLPTFSYGDAIGDDVIEIRNLLREMGYTSDIFAQHIHPKLSSEAKDYKTYRKVSSKNNILIFHHSIGNEIYKYVLKLMDRKILIYHNITPAEFMRDVNDRVYYDLKKGREQLKSFADKVELALGDSEYNQLELVKYGFKNTGALPIIIDFQKYEIEPSQKVLLKYNDGYANILYVGRIAPNKKIEDLIKIFYFYKKFINKNSRLLLVGTSIDMDKYFKSLHALIEKLNLTDVFFLGHVEFKELVGFYNVADVFITMSEHEGFCVPLLESMYFKVPIIAVKSTAIPYTLGDSGILINKKDYEIIGEMLNLVVEQDTLRNRIIHKQCERLKFFERARVKQLLNGYLKDLL